MITDWNAEDFSSRKHQQRVQPEEDGDGLTSAKSQLGVIFIDERGRMLALQYHSLLYAEAVKDDLVVTFSTHKVTMTGYGLVAPVQSSLMMLLTLHKRAIVKAKAGGEERNFGPPGDGWQVVTMTWEKVET